MTKIDREKRIQEVAFVNGSHLPKAFQEAILTEDARMTREVLDKRKLDERHILIVGGAGYVGSVLTDHFLKRGYKVRVADILLYNHGLTVVPFLADPRYQFMNADMANKAEMEKALEGITDVIMLAGLVGDPVTKKFPEAAKIVNDDGHANFITQLNGRGLNKVVFVSTCSNYGFVEGDALADESWELKPLSLYAKSKVAVETALLSQKGKTDYTPTILRFATAFGLSARMRFDLTVSEFTRALALGEDLLVYDGHTWRPYCHLRDFADLIERTLVAPVDWVAHEVFNAGGEVNNYTKQMIVDAVLAQLPGATVRYQDKGPDPRNYRVSFAKVRKALSFEPSYSVPQGVAELIAAIRQGLFHDVSQPNSFYGNYDVVYKSR
jgi:nucleoside-diphosphate-sugar epimerase